MPQEKSSLAEKICLRMNRRFKPPKSMEALIAGPSAAARAEHSRRAAREHFRKSQALVPEGDAPRVPVLDLGCGYGGMTALLAENFAVPAIGLDNDPRALSAAGKYIRVGDPSPSPVRFIAADAGRLPFRPETFSRIYTIATMEHFADPARVMEECRRILRKDGLLYIAFSPYYAYNGSHLFDLIYIPWCHLLFPRKPLIRAWKKLAEGSPDLAGLNPAVDRQKDRLVGINKISVRRFNNILRGSLFRVLSRRELTFDRPSLRFLRKIPLLKELLTNEIIVVLAK